MNLYYRDRPEQVPIFFEKMKKTFPELRYYLNSRNYKGANKQPPPAIARNRADIIPISRKAAAEE